MPCENCNCEHGSKPKHESVWVSTNVAQQIYPSLKENITADVAIIGGGITGLTTAYLLSKAGKKVVVLEANTIGSGVTGYTTAHITVALDTRYQKLVKRLGLDKAKQIASSQQSALDFIKQTITTEQIECDLQSVPGYLYTQTEDDVSDLKQELETIMTSSPGSERSPGVSFAPLLMRIRQRHRILSRAGFDVQYIF